MSERNGHDGEALAARVAELEKTVAALERRVAELGGGAVQAAPDASGGNSRAPRYSAEAAAEARAAEAERPGDPFATAPAGVSAATPAAPDPRVLSATAPAAGASAATAASPGKPPGPTPYAPYPLIPDTSARRPTVTFGSGAEPGQWVNRLGIALLLLGAAFGFKYSVERGWIGPAVRVACGLGMSALLLLASNALRSSRSGLSHMLGGGGIACAYLTIYAAFQLYALVGLGGAFAAMSAVTALAFALAHRDDDAAMATLGALGGLATPFLLDTGARDVTGLVVYTSLVVTAASAVFLSRGWRVLMTVTAFGAWLVVGSLAAQLRFGTIPPADAASVQGAIVFVALATWWIAVMRDLLVVEDPQRWPATRFGLGEAADVELRFGDPGWARQAREFALATPVAVFLASAAAWDVEQHAAGWIALSLAAGWGGAALHLRRLGEPGRVLSASHAAGAAVMVAFATALLLGDDARRFGLAAEALALLMAARAGDGRAARLGHLLFLVVSVETFFEMSHAMDSITFRLGATELSELSVVVMLLAASPVSPPSRRRIYFVAGQGGWLWWLMTVLSPLPHGGALTTTAWFATAVLLVAAGLGLRRADVRRAGAGVMTVTMARLFLVDLGSVDGLWRIATFLGFGAVLLVLGYAFPALWAGQEGEGDGG